MVYEEAPRRAEIESMIEAAMEGHIQLTGSTRREREQILEVSEPVKIKNFRSSYLFLRHDCALYSPLRAGIKTRVRTTPPPSRRTT